MLTGLTKSIDHPSNMTVERRSQTVNVYSTFSSVFFVGADFASVHGKSANVA